MGESVQKSLSISADNPIRKPEDDVLGRNNTALSFMKQVLALDVSEGAVVGVLGPWGSGKTSFVNLSRFHFESEGITVLDFNPWMFSGAEQLMEAFFVELSVQLKIRPELAEAGRVLEDYGEVFSGLGWLPLVGPWVERGRLVAKILSKILQRKKEGIGGRRVKVENVLKAFDKPFVVILDDIDRLTTPEIRDIFKLIRLIASFPNIIYIVAIDRKRVENALGEEGIPGRDYLEKILQVGVDLPAVPTHILSKQITHAIKEVLSQVDNIGPFDEEMWANVFIEILIPLIRNMRDVRRYMAAVQGTVRDLNGRIAIVDIIALEAIRVFLPDVFQQLYSAVGALTTTSILSYREPDETPHQKAQINQMIESACEHADVVKSLIERLFPGGQKHIGGSRYGSDWNAQWLRDRRVAHEDIFLLYLERVVGDNLQSFIDAEQAWKRVTDIDAFDRYLRSLDVNRLEDVIRSLEAYEEYYGQENAVNGVIVLLNLMPELPERQGGLLDFGSKNIVRRVIYRLVRSLKDPVVIGKTIREILPKVTTLSSKLDLISIVGYREGIGHKLVSEATARDLERDFRLEVRAANVEMLAKERDLLRVLLFVKRSENNGEPSIEIPDSPNVTLMLLSSSWSEVRKQTMGSYSVKRSGRLAWDILIELYGEERILHERISKLKSIQHEGEEALIQLADKYITGWRPKEFEDD